MAIICMASGEDFGVVMLIHWDSILNGIITINDNNATQVTKMTATKSSRRC